MVLYLHTYYSVKLLLDPGILVLEWAEKSEESTKEDYFEAMQNFAGFGHEYKAEAMLVDLSFFTLKPTLEMCVWHNEELTPRFASLGLKKFAYLISNNQAIPPQVEKAIASGAMFEEIFFKDKTDALNWLTYE